MLNFTTHKEIINSYSELKWKPLLDLIPEIENTKNFGEAQVIIEDNGIINFPFYKWDEVVSKFHKVVYDIPIMISFDWGSWDEGRMIANNEDFDFDTIDIPTKCKLISAIVRNDRFCEGALLMAFRSGFMVKILKSIKRQLKF